MDSDGIVLHSIADNAQACALAFTNVVSVILYRTNGCSVHCVLSQ